ncbi:MAG TPA: VOC family protein [Bryobacteraceae bacterium]|nr:VOC family protein [Bryobacteraceae bacterium]
MSKPEGYHTITPYLMIRGAADAIDFYTKAFGATEVMRDMDEAGRVRHAEIKIGDSHAMIVDETPKFPEMRSVQAFGGSPMNMFLYVDDADASAQRALAAGATLIMEVRDQSYGRSGGVKDPYGLDWWICS